MKKLLLTFVVALFSCTLNAQSSFEKNLKSNIEKAEKAKTAEDYSNLFENFAQLTKSEFNENWKAYYYAALMKYNEVELLLESKSYELLSDNNWSAFKYLTSISESQKNQEVINLLSFIKSQREKIEKLK